MVLDFLKISSDDAYYTPDHVIFLLNKFRAFVLKNKYDSGKESPSVLGSAPPDNQVLLSVYFLWLTAFLVHLKEHFETQFVMRDDDGSVIQPDDGESLRPDVLLHLDDKRDIIIDSKVSMTAYIDYANDTDDTIRRLHLKEHIASLRKHVDELSAKNYPKYQTNPHLDFVIMFVPHVPALRDALQEEPTLWQDAMQKKVFIADEQTLYAALRIIRITWTHIDQEKNHKRIFELAQEMINRTGLFLEEYETIGQSLRAALDAFESSKKKLKPDGRSISTTANQILKLGLDNKKGGRKGKAPESIIPAEYLTTEVKTELLEEASEASEE